MKISLQQIMMHIICSFVVSNYILSGLLHHAVESYVLNPKAIHPNGRLPSITNDQLAPDWDRSERRRSVDDLQTYLDNSHDKPRVDDGLYNTLRCIGSIHEWINRGLSGIEIGRVTKGGSILYEIR